MIHEFDSGVASDTEIHTTANIQLVSLLNTLIGLSDIISVHTHVYNFREMMPGAVTPLSYSTFIRSIEYAGQVKNTIYI